MLYKWVTGERLTDSKGDFYLSPSIKLFPFMDSEVNKSIFFGIIEMVLSILR